MQVIPEQRDHKFEASLGFKKEDILPPKKKKVL
jgi:hypothetical protein